MGFVKQTEPKKAPQFVKHQSIAVGSDDRHISVYGEPTQSIWWTHAVQYNTLPCPHSETMGNTIKIPNLLSMKITENAFEPQSPCSAFRGAMENKLEKTGLKSHFSHEIYYPMRSLDQKHPEHWEGH